MSPESIDKIGGAAVCLLAVWLMYRSDQPGISRELAAPVLPAIAFALIASSPMLIGFAFTRSLTPHILPLFLTVMSPLVEKIEFRGFGVRQLQRGTGWPFWVVVWPSALLFGYGHVEQGQGLQETVELFFTDSAPCKGDMGGLLRRYPVTASGFYLIGKETGRGWEHSEDISTLLPSLMCYQSASVAGEQLKSRHTILRARMGKRMHPRSLRLLGIAVAQLRGNGGTV